MIRYREWIKEEEWMKEAREERGRGKIINVRMREEGIVRKEGVRET